MIYNNNNIKILKRNYNNPKFRYKKKKNRLNYYQKKGSLPNKK